MHYGSLDVLTVFGSERSLWSLHPINLVVAPLDAGRNQAGAIGEMGEQIEDALQVLRCLPDDCKIPALALSSNAPRTAGLVLHVLIAANVACHKTRVDSAIQPHVSECLVQRAALW